MCCSWVLVFEREYLFILGRSELERLFLAVFAVAHCLSEACPLPDSALLHEIFVQTFQSLLLLTLLTHSLLVLKNVYVFIRHSSVSHFVSIALGDSIKLGLFRYCFRVDVLVYTV